MYPRSMFRAKIRKHHDFHLKIIVYTAVKINVYFMGPVCFCNFNIGESGEHHFRWLTVSLV